MRINLIKRKRKKIGFNLSFFVIILLLVVTISLGIFHYHRTYSKYSRYKARISRLNNQTKELIVKKNEFNQLNNKIEQLLNNTAPKKSFLWNRLLVVLGSQIPEKIMITNLQIDANNATITGLAENGKIISEFIDRLKSSLLFRDVELVNLLKNNQLSYVIKGQLNTNIKGED
jgi:Tfp pilus assembly protein PilN